MLKRICLILVVFILSPAFQARAEQEKMRFGMNYSIVQVNNLPIGAAVSMTKLLNLPVVVTNTFKQPIVVSITPLIPQKVHQGYEAIPDVSWIIVEKKRLEVPANGQASMDLIIKIPDDKKHLNKKYHVAIQLASVKDVSSKPGVVFHLTMTGKLLFSIAPVPNKQELVKALQNPADANFALLPERLDFYEIKPGEVFAVSDKRKEPVFLKNNTSQKQTFHIFVVNAKDTVQRLDFKAQKHMLPDDVEILKDEITLKPGKKKSVPLKINVPETVDFNKGPIVYVVSVKSGQSRGIERQLMIYCYQETEKEMEEKRNPPRPGKKK